MIKSRCPSKQLLYFWVMKDIPKYSRVPVALDVGCGPFGFYSLFKSQKYVGIDMQPQELCMLSRESGDSKHVDQFICDDFLLLEAKGDFVLCVQVLTSQHFDQSRTLFAIQRLIEQTQTGGVLILNTSKATTRYEPILEEYLRRNFKRVIIRRYGAWSRQRTKGAPLLAGLMWAVPWLRHQGCHTKSYYVCEGKHAV